jgi:hypothetical protein
MKKYLLVIVALFIIGTSSASAQAVWGARVGLSRPTIAISYSGDGSFNSSLEGKIGLELGPVLYYSLKKNFYINSGAMFSIKTATHGESLSLYFLDVPLYVGYNIPAGNISFYAQAGPFVGIKLGENKKSGLGSFNAGLGLMGGINVKRFKIELGYQLGMVNLFNDSNVPDYVVKLSSIFLGVSYVF